MNEGGQFEDSFAARLQGESFSEPKRRKSKKLLGIIIAIVSLVVIGIGVYLVVNRVSDSVSRSSLSSDWDEVGAYLLFGDYADAPKSIPEELSGYRLAVFDNNNWSNYYSSSLSKLSSFRDKLVEKGGYEKAVIEIEEIGDELTMINILKFAPTYGNDKIVSAIQDGVYDSGKNFANSVYREYYDYLISDKGIERLEALSNVTAYQYDILNYYISRGCSPESVSDGISCSINVDDTLSELIRKKNYYKSIVSDIESNIAVGQLFEPIKRVKGFLNE